MLSGEDHAKVKAGGWWLAGGRLAPHVPCVPTVPGKSGLFTNFVIKTLAAFLRMLLESFGQSQSTQSMWQVSKHTHIQYIYIIIYILYYIILYHIYMI